MQSSILAVDVFISNTTKLFFPPKDTLLETDKMRSTSRKNLIISTLCLMPCALISLPTQAATENSAIPATKTAIPVAAITPTTNTAIPAAVTPPATNTAIPAAATTPATETVVTRPANEIGNLIASKQHPYLTRSDFTHRAEDLDALYQASGYQPIWLSNDSNATKHVAEVIKLLEDAPNHGLNVADYDIPLLQQKLTALKPPLDIQSKDLALYDTAISLSLLRFTHDLHYGRINPKKLDFNIQLRTEKTLDLPALIKTSLAQNTLSQLPSLVEPKLPQYQKLKQALISYRAPEKAPSLKLIVKSSIRPGDPLPQSAELQQFLLAFGDLPADKIDNTASTYTDNMVEAIKKFQQRHGMKATGIINKATANAFNAPAAQVEHITQIELAMERLRWLPEINEGPVIMVNIPAFQLLAFDDINQARPTTTMRVVVGKAAKNKTPLLTADMRFVDFQPYWNVPYKIAKDEILPKLAEDPDYLVRQNMEFVSSSGNSALRIRQRPGKGNALGKVKFIFPNKSDVYLHDTPSVSLFGRSRRDLSHGCVRVAHPQELAEFVLKNEGDWDISSIKKAMNGRNRRVVLKNTIPVLFLYNTAFFDENNNLAFYSDIYHHDVELLNALKNQEDLSDEGLFAPKEEVPPTNEPSTEQIEATKAQPVVATNTKQVIPPLVAINTKQVIPAIEPVATTEAKTTLSP
ncbi:MAG: L,D-transpeptidase family protein [Methylococcaceae bacterium]|nr:L,D-transpeptidase family protein [Methylococcaceae bacterium]